MPLTRALLAASVTAPAGRKVAAPTGGLLPVAAQSSHPLDCWKLRHCTRWQEAGRPDWRAAGGSTVLAPLGLLAASSPHPLAGSCRPPLPWRAAGGSTILAPLGLLAASVAAPAGRKLAAPTWRGCRWQHGPRTPWPAGSAVTAPAGRKLAAPRLRRAAGGSTILAPLGLLAAPSLHPLAGSWPPRLAGCRWQHGPRTRWPAGTFRHRTRWREVAATDMHCRTPGRAHSSCSLAAHAAAVEGRRSARLMA